FEFISHPQGVCYHTGIQKFEVGLARRVRTLFSDLDGNEIASVLPARADGVAEHDVALGEIRPGAPCENETIDNGSNFHSCVHDPLACDDLVIESQCGPAA